MITDNPNFTWWIGVVEWNVDPALLGRVKVRIFGYHSAAYLNEIETENLPWASCLNAANVHGAYGRPSVGEWVLGFFLDGSDAQEPMVLGVIPGNIKSNMGDLNAKWSVESEVSFPSVYQKPLDSEGNSTNGSDLIQETTIDNLGTTLLQWQDLFADSNRDAYIQEILGKVKFKLNPDSGLSSKPKVSLTMPQDNVGIEIYSDDIFPTKPINPTTYLNIANGSNASIEITNQYEQNKNSKITMQADEIVFINKNSKITMQDDEILFKNKDSELTLAEIEDLDARITTLTQTVQVQQSVIDSMAADIQTLTARIDQLA